MNAFNHFVPHSSISLFPSFIIIGDEESFQVVKCCPSFCDFFFLKRWDTIDNVRFTRVFQKNMSWSMLTLSVEGLEKGRIVRWRPFLNNFVSELSNRIKGQIKRKKTREEEGGQSRITLEKNYWSHFCLCLFEPCEKEEEYWLGVSLSPLPIPHFSFDFGGRKKKKKSAGASCGWTRTFNSRLTRSAAWFR